MSFDMSVLQRIGTSAYGRYQAGFAINDAVESACSGYKLDEFSRTLVESYVIAAICKATQSVDVGYCELTWKICARLQDPTFDPMPILQRARAAQLQGIEAAVLSVCAHAGRIWQLASGIAKAIGVEGMIKPEPSADLADRQSALAKQIAKIALDDRMHVIVDLRFARFDGPLLDTLCALVRCKEIYDALAQVRFPLTILEIDP